MIRINLLGVERQTKKRASFSFDSSQQTMAGCVLLLVLTVAGIGYWFWSLRQASEQLDADIAAAQSEQRRLQSILREVATSRRVPQFRRRISAALAPTRPASVDS